MPKSDGKRVGRDGEVGRRRRVRDAKVQKSRRVRGAVGEES
jgi:hypothetical protein